MVVTLGALLAEVPHSRPVNVVGTAYDESVVTRLGLPPSEYQGPTGILGVLHDRCRTAGVESASLWATVPTYVPGAPSPKATLALVEKPAALLGEGIVTTHLENASASHHSPLEQPFESTDRTQAQVPYPEPRPD